MYTSLLAWRERRYLWWALGLILLSVGLYSSEIMNPGQPSTELPEGFVDESGLIQVSI